MAFLLTWRPWASRDDESTVTAQRHVRRIPSAAQSRIITASVELFGRHGVGGTSLQMIADELGVTKAAVYHQYRTKDEIVLAAAEAELAGLAAVVDAAEQERPGARARDALITGIVELAVDRRHSVGSILNDPVIVTFFDTDDAFRDVMHRVRRLLVGGSSGHEGRIRTAMLLAAISGTVMHPFVADVSDDALRAQLVRLARRFLGLRS
jgi:AcrR family transcriptional regulator